MKTNLLVLSAILACSSLSFAATSSGASGYNTGNTSSSTQGGTGNQPTKDGSQSVYDRTINPSQNSNTNSMNKNTRQGRASMSDPNHPTKDTDNSGHKTDQAPTTQE
jgi:hypothetical protein